MWFSRHEITPSRIVARMNESMSRPSLAVIQEHSGGIESMQREVMGWPWSERVVRQAQIDRVVGPLGIPE